MKNKDFISSLCRSYFVLIINVCVCVCMSPNVCFSTMSFVLPDIFFQGLLQCFIVMKGKVYFPQPQLRLDMDIASMMPPTVAIVGVFPPNWLCCLNWFCSGFLELWCQWCSAGYLRYTECAHLFFSMHWVHLLLNPLWSYLLQISCSKRLFTKETTGLLARVFFMCGWLKNKEKICLMPNFAVVSPRILTVGQYQCKICTSVVANVNFIIILFTPWSQAA